MIHWHKDNCNHTHHLKESFQFQMPMPRETQPQERQRKMQRLELQVMLVWIEDTDREHLPAGLTVLFDAAALAL